MRVAFTLNTLLIFSLEVEIRYCSNMKGVKKLRIKWSFRPKYIPVPHVCAVRVAQHTTIAVDAEISIFCNNLNRTAFEKST